MANILKGYKLGYEDLESSEKFHRKARKPKFKKQDPRDRYRTNQRKIKRSKRK